MNEPEQPAPAGTITLSFPWGPDSRLGQDGFPHNQLLAMHYAPAPSWGQDERVTLFFATGYVTLCQPRAAEAIWEPLMRASGTSGRFSQLLDYAVPPDERMPENNHP